MVALLMGTVRVVSAQPVAPASPPSTDASGEKSEPSTPEPEPTGEVDGSPAVEAEGTAGTAAAAAGAEATPSDLEAEEDDAPSNAAFLVDPGAIGGDLNDPTAEGFAGMSLADLMQIDVVTATKSAVSLTEAPAIISVVTREDIQLWGYSSLEEVLRHTLGFYVVDDHAVPDASVRGVSVGLFSQSGLIKVMVNGESTAFRTDASNWIGPELIPMSAVERIEIIRGPSSALYGADAFLGVVNIITRSGGKVNGGQFAAGVRAYERLDLARNFDIAVGGESGKLEILLAGREHSEDRSGLKVPGSSPMPRIPSYRDKLEARHATGTAASLYGTLRYHFTKDFSLAVVGYRSQFARGWEFGPWLQLPYGLDEDGRPHETRLSQAQSKIGLVGDLNLGAEKSLTARVSYSNGKPLSADHVDVGSGVFGVRRDFGYNSVDGAVDGSFALAEHLDLVTSADGAVDRVRVPSPVPVLKIAVDGLKPGSELTREQAGERTLSNVGALGQLRYSAWAPLLSLTGGARLDYHSIYGAVPSGRLAAVSQPREGLTLKLLYGNAFKAPSPLLLFAVPLTVGDIVGNPGLRPQRVHSTEFQITYLPLDALGLTSGVTYNKVLDVAEFVQQGVNQTARNLASMDMISWETEAKLTYEEELGVTTSYELVYGKRGSGALGYQADLVGQEQVVYPHHIVRAGVWGKIPSLPLRTTAEGLWAGKRRSSPTHTLLHGAPYDLDSYLLADFGLSTVDLMFLKKKLTTISIKARNTLDVVVADSGVAGVDYPLLPRSLSLTLTQEL